MKYGKSGERPGADKNIAEVELPKKDPVYGDGGLLRERWGLSVTGAKSRPVIQR